MKFSGCLPLLAEQKSRHSCFCTLLPVTTLLCLVLFVGSAYIAPDYRQKISKWGIDGFVRSKFSKCENQCRPNGSDPLPKDIVVTASNLEMRPLWGASKRSYQKPVNVSSNLFAVAVGIKQKDLVNTMVTKFLASDFAVMLFHYDGIVDKWKEFEWSNRVVHVTAINQTKWWFAKRFLHPDIVAAYNYIFLWDEDLGVDNFNPNKYVHIIESEGLEISQPALDPLKSEVHHQITARGRRSKVHRRTYKPSNGGKGCDINSTAPPCTGWIEMMAPVFSRASWRCVWYMIQNDLIHAWGLDMQLGYCAQGDRTKNVGVVDSEYVIHHGRPTLGGPEENETSSKSPVKDHRADWPKPTASRYCPLWMVPFKLPLKVFKTRLLGRGIHMFIRNVSFPTQTGMGSHNPSPWEPRSSLAHRSMFGSDIICNNPSPPLACIVLFGFPLKVFKTQLLERGFHTLTKNASFSSPTDVGSHRFFWG